MMAIAQDYKWCNTDNDCPCQTHGYSSDLGQSRPTQSGMQGKIKRGKEYTSPPVLIIP
ncbi:hypothetical protein EV690_2756 [Celerinatantimonas diazotrophica]|uniref:Uncharacterized protein n=1 Tax=Celerinatantimonas diazotrophica TaxID=412034 RepID=A0A4R1J8X3_9GAMM|nr:hypothetical protein EV690_2756 [Celerinatantimonas diazotrophica]CAG9295832.1 hypothetical protein CEDIAZO_00964 [Celerinatantimonas diazotrophica]